MILRRNILPTKITDIACFFLIATFIPITFFFEVLVVIPEFHAEGSSIYILTWCAGLFLLFNILSNMFACMLVDTSIKHAILKPPTNAEHLKYWSLCSECETVVPPRSWHCHSCKTCILKRDHHCLFTGYCIGHHNHRYFIYFLIYLVIGSAYTTCYNSVYFWWLHADTYANASTILKIILPMFMLTFNYSWANFYLLIYVLNIITFAFSLVLLIYHIPSILKGAVAYERTSPKYDLGWKQNLEMVLGKRMHLVWISPFIYSPLPHDGIHWETILQQSVKNR
ncbi:probable palmitoyltransferase ZDHHC24 isoform X2 [Teleopsis dalmanni]|uniref:probable palmitoyltransferase ZDHHC24 isoform X1 n=1 Tax=Teleopsis dalmanni TaxID=139649 RepID=UPI0018CEC671|nr:probable palmitoyltransferase ZDHHC24 isoform X1 [Teleopsis dalmanni]XP_037957002.1 probable palmitoyltransferase ZDHHC24 isoform X2 [Teleopsis dalmanni]